MPTKTRQLDVDVAKRILRLSNVGWYRRESSDTANWIRGNEVDKTPGVYKWYASLCYVLGCHVNVGDIVPQTSTLLWSLPHYSQEIEHAWRVVDYLTDTGWSVQIGTSLSQHNTAQVRVAISKVIDGAPCEYGAEGQNPARVICRAALKIPVAYPDPDEIVEARAVIVQKSAMTMRVRLAEDSRFVTVPYDAMQDGSTDAISKDDVDGTDGNICVPRWVLE